MGENSGIQWTTHTFNPWEGCQRVSPGCEHCYAETRNHRWAGDDRSKILWGPTAPRRRTSPSNWRKPLKWNADAAKAGRRDRVFCASLADVFEDRPELVEWREELFGLIAATPDLDWLLLTKRPENILRLWPKLMILPASKPSDDMIPVPCFGPRSSLGGQIIEEPWENIWLGTTVEDQRRAIERIPQLLAVPAAVRFLSMEPMLERVALSPFFPPYGTHVQGRPGQGGIDWMIIGGESGAKARPFNVEWARELVRQARTFGVAPFVKQLGANVRTRNDDLLSADYDEGGWALWGDGDVEQHPNGHRDEYQGAEVRVHLKDAAGGDPAEWPEDLRVREFPR